MIMHIKSHNALSPCHMCNIQGVCIPSSWITTHYIPLNHEHFPDVDQYHPNSLPLQDHHTFINQAVKVQTASTTTALEWLAKKYGIKGLPLLTALASLSFPLSFPYNFMHLYLYNSIEDGFDPISLSKNMIKQFPPIFLCIRHSHTTPAFPWLFAVYFCLFMFDFLRVFLLFIFAFLGIFLCVYFQFFRGIYEFLPL